MDKILQSLSEKCRNIVDLYEREIVSTGDDYNLFRILGHTSEELVHSRMIASLLDPEGKHHSGSKFLDVFLDVVGIDKKRFDSAHSSVILEKPIGKIVNDPDCPDGGRIDIFLSDWNGQNIIIENKIYAKDQYKQLTRYKNHKSDGIPILYLTPTGKKPAEYSCKGLKAGVDYKIISYEKHIVEWLERSVKLDCVPENLKYLIVQYSNIVKQITNQSKRIKMKEEIVELIAENKDYLDMSFEINGLIERIQIKAQSIFWKGMAETLDRKYHFIPVFTLDFKGSPARQDVMDPVESTVSSYIEKDVRYFGYDVKIGTFEGHDVYLKICAKKNLLFYVHFQEEGKHDELMQFLKDKWTIDDKWRYNDEHGLCVAWRYPVDKSKKDIEYNMIDYGKVRKPSEYNMEQIAEDFVNVADELTCLLKYKEWVDKVTDFLKKEGPGLGTGGRSCSVMQSAPVFDKAVDVVYLGCNAKEDWGYCGVDEKRFYLGNAPYDELMTWKVMSRIQGAFEWLNTTDRWKEKPKEPLKEGHFVFMNAYYFGTKDLAQLDSLPGIEPLKKKCLEYTEDVIRNVFKPKLIVCFSIPDCFDELNRQCHFQDVQSLTPSYPVPDRYTCNRMVKVGVWNGIRVIGIPHPSQAVSNDDWGCIGNFIFEEMDRMGMSSEVGAKAELSCKDLRE